MFTIKHVHDNGETILRGKEPKLHLDKSPFKEFSYENENGVRLYIVGGNVYVMNDHGKTVAKYDLDDGPRGCSRETAIGPGNGDANA